MSADQTTISDIIATSSIKGLRVDQPVKEALRILGSPDTPPGRIAKDIWLYTFGNVPIMSDDREQIIQISINFEQPYKPKLLLITSGVSTIICPREEAWGHSVSINSIAVSPKTTRQLLSIEMQSGDTIILEANSVRLTAL